MSRKRNQGRGLRKDNLVIDHSTGLTWQQSGSSERLTFAKGQEYIQELNDQSFAGYNDWRLPTLEEAMSLMEPTRNKDSLFIDAKFDSTQAEIWTADEFDASAWVVNFQGGLTDFIHVNFTVYVRGVR